MHKLLTISAFMVYSLVNTSSASAASWNEAVQGDLSNAGLTPSTLLLELGTNAVTGNFGSVGLADRDYLAVTVAAGTQLSGLLFGNGFAIADGRSFIGVQAGSVMTVLPNATSAAGLLGYAHADAFSAVGTDYLPIISTGFGSIGFTGPLSAGIYTFWIQETSSNPGTFAWDFVVTAAPIPEPETYAMLLAGLGFVGARARRRNRKI